MLLLLEYLFCTIFKAKNLKNFGIDLKHCENKELFNLIGRRDASPLHTVIQLTASLSHFSFSPNKTSKETLFLSLLSRDYHRGLNKNNFDH